MKACCLLLVLLIVQPALSIRAGVIGDHKSRLKESSSVAFWPPDCVVNVYFVQKMFTADEKQILWRAIETWTKQARTKGLQISFVAAGETGGLIDCVGCLTIARQGLTPSATRQPASLRALRQDVTGQLSSAWIEFERANGSKMELRTLMLQALEGGLALSRSPNAKGARP